MNKINKIVFVSNFFNHHQKFLSDELYNLVGEGYKFIATLPMNPGRKALGWKEYDMDYIVYSYENDEAYQKSIDLINDADVVIIGSAPMKMIRERVKSAKLTFRYCERFLREGLELNKFFYRFVKYHYWYPMNKPFYLLCSSAYTSADFAKFGLFKKKAFKWAYFTEAKKYENIKELIENKNKTEIVWCGRFLKLKHLDDVITAVGRLAKEGYNCTLKVIGGGNDIAKQSYERLAATITDKKFLNFLGTVSSEEVRTYMEKSGIFVFSSDFREGWGAVVNEAMNSACAVISSHAAGATPFLIDEGKNGMIYESENVDDLYQKLKYLLDNKLVQESMGENAYRTIVDLWSPKNAAERFVALSQAILNGNSLDLYTEGPCSHSLPLKNNWYKSNF